MLRLSCTVTDFGLWVMPLTCYSLFLGFQVALSKPDVCRLLKNDDND